MATFNVAATGLSDDKNKDVKHTTRPVQLTVKRGDSLPSIAKQFGMDTKEFMAWTGLKKSSVSTGQKIDLPSATVPEGRGIYALIRKYNMTLDEFGKLNNLPKPYKDYSASKGEVFYVKNHSRSSANSKTQSKRNAAQVKKGITRTKSAIAAGAKIGAEAVSTVVKNQKTWGSAYTPEELAAKIFQSSSEHWGAVGKPDFDALIDEINPKNAAAVIKAYTENPKNKNKESLINTITSEISSKEGARKAAVMKVYDALATAKKTSASQRDVFKAELDKEFNSWGMVDTEKMDKMISSMLSTNVKSSKSHSAKKSNNSSVKLTKNSGKFTVSSLQKGAIKSAKDEATQKFKSFCKANNIPFDLNKLDLAPIERIPEPTVKGGVIVAKESELLRPTTKPNGKVVILNPGHGGYSSRTGYFDPGSYSFIKKGNGKYAPLLEYEKMNGYAESLTEKLRSQGYAVVITNFHIQTLSDQHSISDLVKNLSAGNKGNKKYNKSDIVFVSLHADSEPGKSGSGICYDSRFSQDSILAENFQKHLNTDDWIKAGLSERNWNVPTKGLQVLHQTEDIPSVLVEVEYVNGSKSKNLDSSAYQNRFENKLISGLNSYFDR